MKHNRNSGVASSIIKGNASKQKLIDQLQPVRQQRAQNSRRDSKSSRKSYDLPLSRNFMQMEAYQQTAEISDSTKRGTIENEQLMKEVEFLLDAPVHEIIDENFQQPSNNSTFDMRMTHQGPVMDQSIGPSSCTNQTAQTTFNNNFSALPKCSPDQKSKSLIPRIPKKARNQRLSKNTSNTTTLQTEIALPPTTFGRGSRGLIPTYSDQRKSSLQSRNSYYSGSVDSRGAKKTKKYKRSKKELNSESSENGLCNITLNNSKIIQFEQAQHDEPFVDDEVPHYVDDDDSQFHMATSSYGGSKHVKSPQENSLYIRKLLKNEMIKEEQMKDEIQEEQMNSLYMDYQVDEKDECIPLTTVVDDELTNSSHHQSHEIEQKIFDDLQSAREQEDKILAQEGSFMMIQQNTHEEEQENGYKSIPMLMIAHHTQNNSLQTAQFNEDQDLFRNSYENTIKIENFNDQCMSFHEYKRKKSNGQDKRSSISSTGTTAKSKKHSRKTSKVRTTKVSKSSLNLDPMLKNMHRGENQSEFTQLSTTGPYFATKRKRMSSALGSCHSSTAKLVGKVHHNISLHQGPNDEDRLDFQEINVSIGDTNLSTCEVEEQHYQPLRRNLQKGFSHSIHLKPEPMQGNFLEKETVANSMATSPMMTSKFLNPKLIDQRIVNRDLINLQIKRPSSATKTQRMRELNKSFLTQSKKERKRSTSAMNRSVVSASGTKTLPKHQISSFDPSKSTIIQSHLSHKSKVSTLKHQFQSQKLLEKKTLLKQIEVTKTKLVQTKKLTKNTNINIKKQYEQIKLFKETIDKKKKDKNLVSGQHQGLSKQLNLLDEDLDEIMLFKLSLKNELKSEKKLVGDIQAIVLKYKKLLNEQTREKEKLSQQVKNTRKVIQNLQQRRDVLAEDSNKLYDNFQTTIDNDQMVATMIRKKNLISDMSNKSILDC